VRARKKRGRGVWVVLAAVGVGALCAIAEPEPARADDADLSAAQGAFGEEGHLCLGPLAIEEMLLLRARERADACGACGMDPDAIARRLFAAAGEAATDGVGDGAGAVSLAGSREERGEEGYQIFGAKAMAVNAFQAREEEEYSFGVGLGAFYEFPVLENRLQLELAGNAIWMVSGSERGVELPLDVRFKLSYEVGDAATFYVGAGPVIQLEVLDHAFSLEGGVSAVVGTYLWFSDDWGLDVEIDYDFFYPDRRPKHEVVPALGIVYRVG